MSQSKTKVVHTLKVLGLSALAMLALSAVAASGAQAEGKFLAGKYPASLTGTGTSTHSYVFGGGVREASCKSSEFVGELTAASETVQMSPGYGLCYSNFASQPIKIFAAGCTYGWSVTNLTSATTATGTGSMTCPGSQFRIDTYENNQKYSEGITLCEYGIPSQGPLGTVEYEDLGSGSTASVGVSVKLSGLTVNVLKGGKLTCGAKTGETTTASYTGNVSLIAKNAGVQTGLSIG